MCFCRLYKILRNIQKAREIQFSGEDYMHEVTEQSKSKFDSSTLVAPRPDVEDTKIPSAIYSRDAINFASILCIRRSDAIHYIHRSRGINMTQFSVKERQRQKNTELKKQRTKGDM
jgi:hypothetical protein